MGVQAALRSSTHTRRRSCGVTRTSAAATACTTACQARLSYGSTNYSASLRAILRVVLLDDEKQPRSCARPQQLR